MKKKIDLIFHGSFLSQASVSIIITFLVIFLIGKEALLFFKQVPFLEFLTGNTWRPLLSPPSYGVLPLILGSLSIVIGSIIFSLPLGIGLSVFMQEYKPKMRPILKPLLEILAGIPTVVYGYFALTFITPQLKTFFPQMEVFNALSASLVVGLMILPMICSLCDDAFSALPVFLKQGGYALGLRSFEVVLFILIPASYKRLAAAFLLAISRALGETMAVTLAAGSTPQMGLDFFKGIQTMTAYIVQVSLGDTSIEGLEFLSLFAIAATLFVMTLALNILGHLLVSKKELRC